MITTELRRRAITARALRMYAEAFEANYHQRLKHMHAEMDPYEFRKQMDALSDNDAAALQKDLDSMPPSELFDTLDSAIWSLNGAFFRKYGMGALLRRALCEVRSHLVDASDSLSFGDVFSAREALDEALGLITDLLERRNQVAKRAERVLVDDPHARQIVTDIAALVKQAQRGVMRSAWSRSA